MIKKGDYIKIYNRSYTKDNEPQIITTEQYYVVSKIECSTLFVEEVIEPADGNTIYTIGDLKGKYSIYAE